MESEVGLTKEERSAKSMEEPEKPKRSRERKGEKEKGKGPQKGMGKPPHMMGTKMPKKPKEAQFYTTGTSSDGITEFGTYVFAVIGAGFLAFQGFKCLKWAKKNDYTII